MRNIAIKKQLSLNETHVKVWYKAFILLNRLSMRFVTHEIKEGQKARRPEGQNCLPKELPFEFSPKNSNKSQFGQSSFSIGTCPRSLSGVKTQPNRTKRHPCRRYSP